MCFFIKENRLNNGREKAAILSERVSSTRLRRMYFLMEGGALNNARQKTEAINIFRFFLYF